MSRSLFRRLGVIFSIFPLLVLAGCSGASGNSAQSASGSVDISKVTLNVADIQWKEDEALLKAAGLSDTKYKVNVQVFDGGNNSIQAVNSGKVDVTRTSEIPPVFAASQQGAGNLTIPALLNDGITGADQGVLVAPGSAIKTITDLKGKKVGYVEGTTAQYFLYKFLQSNGLGWGDIQAEKLSPADGATALLNGNIDAFAGFGGGVNAAVAKGATYLAQGSDVLPAYYPYVAPKATLADATKRAALFDYLGRLSAAYSWVAQHPDDWAKTSAQPNGATVEARTATIKAGVAKVKTQVVAPSDQITQGAQDVANVFQQVGLLKGQVDAATLFDSQYSAELASAIKQYA